jgi:uncharacterized protein (DUF433 family)
MTTLILEAQSVPLHEIDGVFLVGKSRVPVDTVIHAYDRGFTPEEIALQFPVLQLNDVYSVLSYYLNNRDAVDSYLSTRREHSEQIRHENERRFPSDGIRHRLTARQQND